MVGGGSVSTTGSDKPGTEGDSYGRQVLESTINAERIFAIGIDSMSVLVQAHPNNTGNIFLGWDENVTSNNGIVLEPGDTISMDIDLDQQNMWAIAATANDELRFIVLS